MRLLIVTDCKFAYGVAMLAAPRRHAEPGISGAGCVLLEARVAWRLGVGSMLISRRRGLAHIARRNALYIPGYVFTRAASQVAVCFQRSAVFCPVVCFGGSARGAGSGRNPCGPVRAL